MSMPSIGDRMSEPASIRSMRSFARAHVEGLLRRARRDYVVPGSALADKIDHLVADVKNAEFRRGDESDEARDAWFALEKVLTAVEDQYIRPQRALEERLLFQSLDNYLNGRAPGYGGDYVAKRGLDEWGNYTETVETGGHMRTKVVLEAVAVEELQAIQKEIHGTITGSDEHSAATERLEEFFTEHNLQLPGENNQGNTLITTE